MVGGKKNLTNTIFVFLIIDYQKNKTLGRKRSASCDLPGSTQNDLQLKLCTPKGGRFLDLYASIELSQHNLNCLRTIQVELLQHLGP